jgi:hypothetical protein
MLTSTQTTIPGAARVNGNFPRRPQTTFMGLMALALLGMTGWAFVHELLPGAQAPSLARHAPAAFAHPRAKG